MSDELLEYRAMFDQIEGRVLRRVEIGGRLRVAIVVVMAAAVLAMCLPQAGDASGWSALVAANAAQSQMVGVLAQISVHASVMFCVIVTCAAVRSAYFPVMVVALAGCAVTAVFAFLAIWARQSSHVAPSGPGVGAILVFVTAAILTGLWASAVLRSTNAGMP